MIATNQTMGLLRLCRSSGESACSESQASEPRKAAFLYMSGAKSTAALPIEIVTVALADLAELTHPRYLLRKQKADTIHAMFSESG